MRASNRAKVCIEILMLSACMAACGKADSAKPGSDAVAESREKAENQTEIEIQEKAEIQAETETIANSSEQEAEGEESGEMTQAEQKYTYRGDAVLSKDTIEKTMKTFLRIEDETSLYRLEKLPLTEEFFYECIEHVENFPYVESDDIQKMKNFILLFWGIREDGKCVCLCEFGRSGPEIYPEGSFYYVVMDLENDQIASMEVTLVEKYTPKRYM